MIIKLEEEKRELGKFCVAKLILSTVNAFTFYEKIKGHRCKKLLKLKLLKAEVDGLEHIHYVMLSAIPKVNEINIRFSAHNQLSKD
jgi:hypothetical protein